MKTNAELDNFNNAMDAILRADPKVVKAQMESEKSQREEARQDRKTKQAEDTQDESK